MGTKYGFVYLSLLLVNPSFCFSMTGYEQCILDSVASSSLGETIYGLQNKCRNSYPVDGLGESIVVELPIGIGVMFSEIL